MQIKRGSSERAIAVVLVLIAIAAVLLVWSLSRAHGQQPISVPEPRAQSLTTEGKWLRLDQPGFRVIYFRADVVTTLVVWEPGKHYDTSDPVLGIGLGPEKYRLNCDTVEQANRFASVIREA